MLNRTVVNNAMLDPLQGFDTDVFVLDQATGNQIMVGRFTGFQWTVRNATEPYMEFNQRIPRLLDGEFQFGWVLEQGLIDTEIMVNIFGYDHLGREMRPDRSPRLQLTVEYNAPALASGQGTAGGSASRNALDAGGELLRLGNGEAPGNSAKTSRNTQGRYHLQNCKVDSVTSGAVAGRQVVAVRLEGLCEGFYYEKLDGSSTSVNERAGSLPLIDRATTPTIANSGALGRNTREIANWSDFFPQTAG